MLHVVCYFYLLNCLVVGKCFGTDPISCFLSVLNSGRCFCYNQFILLMFYVRLLKCSPMLLCSCTPPDSAALCMYAGAVCLNVCLFVWWSFIVLVLIRILLISVDVGCFRLFCCCCLRKCLFKCLLMVGLLWYGTTESEKNSSMESISHASGHSKYKTKPSQFISPLPLSESVYDDLLLLYIFHAVRGALELAGLLLFQMLT